MTRSEEMTVAEAKQLLGWAEEDRDRLKAERDTLQQREAQIVKALGVPDAGRYINDIVQHVESLQQRVKELEGALERIAHGWEANEMSGRACQRIARQALKDTE